MKMNATKLTIALVALLLALTCVFAACGKKNNTDKPDDTTPVDNTPVVVDTVAKEDLTAVAESLKAAYAANYVDLYSAETATAIEAEKSAALVKILAATSKEEAQKVADDFITYLKSQKTIIDSIAALVEKIGDVSLKDVDALNELDDVVKTLDAAYAGNNAAKKVALDAYKADTATQKTIKDIVDRFDELKAAKKAADAKAGLNAQIAELKADFTAEGKEFVLADFGDYEDLLAAMAAFAKNYDLVEGTDAYADVFDMVTLKAAKAALDAAFSNDPVLKAMLTIVEQAKALAAAAEEAQWREYVYVDKTTLNVEDEEDITNGYIVPLNIDGKTKYGKFAYTLADTMGALTGTITLPDGKVKYYDATKFTAYATEKAAKAADIKDVVKIEATITLDYKLSLKAAVETAVAAKDAVLKTHSTKELEDNYGYNKTGDPVKPAVTVIETIAANYTTSVNNAYNAYVAAFGTNAAPTVLGKKTNVRVAKDDTLGTYSLQKEADLDTSIKFTNKKVADNQAAIYDAIENAIKNFTAKDEASGALVSGKTLYQDGLANNDYLAEKGSATHGYSIVAGQPTISYTAWTYRYELEDEVDLPAGIAKFNALKTLATQDNNATIAKAALRFLAMYIGDGEYADSYDFTEYKKYKAAFADEVLYMVDRDIVEVAVPAVVKIRGAEVNVPADTTDLGAKLLSPYTVAKALVAEQEKIDEAKAEVTKEIIAAALALKTAGDADAIYNADQLYNRIANGKELNTRLEYGLDYYYYGHASAYNTQAQFDYLAVNLSAVVAKVQTKPTVETKLVSALIGDAMAARNAAKASFNAIEATKAAEYVKFATLEGYQDAIDTDDYYMSLNNAALVDFAELINEANRQLEVAKAGVAAKFLDGDLTGATDSAGNITQKAAQKSLDRLTSMQDIFSNYATFYSAYTEDAGKYINSKAFNSTEYAALAPGAKLAVVADFEAFLDDFVPVTMAPKTYEKLVARLVAIVNDSDFTTAAPAVISAVDNARLAEDKAQNERDLKKDLAAYETKILASDVYTAGATKLNAAATAITNFASTFFADYVNLKVSYAIGSQTFEFDYLTETFKNRVLYNSQDVITKVLAYAADTSEATITTDASAALQGPDSWKATVSARIDELGATFNTVTSITAAETLVSNSVVADSNYSYDTAKNVINSAVGNTATVADIKNYVKTH